MQIACGIILFTVILERLAFYGLSGNLVLFLNTKPYVWMSYNALTAMFYFFGISYISPLFGGWLADSIVGRFKAILVAFLIYGAGYAMLPFLAPVSDDIISTTEPLPEMCLVHHDYNASYNSTPLDITSSTTYNSFEENCAWLIYIVLTVIAIGAGSVKANIAPFGADQVQGGDQQNMLVFFNWFYWCVNFGAFIGLGIITYVEQQFYFFYGFISAGSALGFGVVLFILGGFVFIKKPASGSVLSNIFRILKEACRSKRRSQKMSKRDQRYIALNLDENLSFLDYAKLRHGGIFHESIVDDVRELKKILCVFLTLIPYWIVFFQMQTTFLLQGLHMRLMFKDIGNDEVHNNTVAAWLSLADAMILILMLPLFDRVIYPRLAKAGRPFTMTKRIYVGMIFAMASMVVAGVVEHFRLKSFWPHNDEPCKNNSVMQLIGENEYQAADLSIFWQIPQYALVGLSEVFTSVAGLQFAVSMAPKSMKSIIMGLFYFMCGIGSFIGTGLISGLNSYRIWFVDGNDHGDINCRLPCSKKEPYFVNNKSCHLDYYFFLLAGVELIGLILFLIVSKVFHLDQDQHNQMPLQLPAGERNSRSGVVHSIQRSISNVD
ncbi:hypothetical protein LOTGIDRAFT_103713 [Lottia gigantea]|uniref:Major facilitator superfamily (MFS) profile domain-containing protein n=1 Tax=Lottia gigantea TaxID=225164 RepID=V4ALI6_LOTGI|nr:hypothetical protein LOTGIDRAFT_103713 [Lottia gigantea]ESO97977.1 hypothetical protein LOTGIDRAFT_103713 [Lottia gigantea]